MFIRNTFIVVALAALTGPVHATLLLDINADGTNRDATTAHFEAAAGLAASSLSGDLITTFDLNGANVTTPNFDQTVDNIRIQVNNGTSTIFGDADGWFGAGSDNNLLEDGLFLRHASTDPSALITLSGGGLGLAANRTYELYLFAGRSQGHVTTFTFDVNDPADPSLGTMMTVDPPVVGGDNTLGTALFTFNTGATAPSALGIQWSGAQNVNGNQDAVFSGFALRDLGVIPEPGTAGLTLMGLLMLVALRGRWAWSRR
jgi:hypothetical protein